MKLIDILNEGSGSSYIIELGNPSSNEVSAVFGGTPSTKYGAAYMKKQVHEFLKNKNVIYCNWEIGFDGALGYLKTKLKNPTITAVYGFSKGGLIAWPAVNRPGVKFVGLMDPSIEGNYKKITSIPNGVTVKMQYLKKRGWGETGLNYAISILGDRAEGYSGKSHFDFPRMMFGASSKPKTKTETPQKKVVKVSPLSDYNF